MRSLLFVFFCVCFLNVCAQPGTFDPTFGSSGIVSCLVGASGLAQQADGKLLVGGTTGNAVAGLARLNDDGTPDVSFGDNGVVSFSVMTGNTAIAFVVAQPDGKIVMSGTTNDNDYDRYAIVRFNADGTFDNTFGT